MTEPTPEPTTNTYEVILNAAALGLPEGQHIRLIEADRVENDYPSGRITFFQGEEMIAQFTHVFGMSKL